MMAVKSAVALFVTLSTLGLAYAQKAAGEREIRGRGGMME